MRPARLSDVPALVELLAEMHEESRVRVFDLNQSKLEYFLQWLIESPTGIVLVAGDPLCGVLMGMVQEMWFGRDKESFNLPVYVGKEHRGGPWAVQLIRGYKARAAELGAKDITLCITSGVEPERTNRFTQKMGFLPIGGYFSLGVPSVR